MKRVTKHTYTATTLSTATAFRFKDSSPLGGDVLIHNEVLANSKILTVFKGELPNASEITADAGRYGATIPNYPAISPSLMTDAEWVTFIATANQLVAVNTFITRFGSTVIGITTATNNVFRSSDSEEYFYLAASTSSADSAFRISKEVNNAT